MIDGGCNKTNIFIKIIAMLVLKILWISYYCYNFVKRKNKDEIFT